VDLLRSEHSRGTLVHVTTARPVDKYQPGKAQPSFDKQPIRDYLENLGWNKKPPAPRLPDEVITASADRYREAQRLLTGKA